MGEYADELINQLMDEGYSPFNGRIPNRKSKKPPAKFYDKRDRGFDEKGKPVKKSGKPKPRLTLSEEAIKAKEYPGAHTPAELLIDYPESLFDMSHFPKGKPRRVPAPTPQPRELRPPLDWNQQAEEEAPF